MERVTIRVRARRKSRKPPYEFRYKFGAIEKARTGLLIKFAIGLRVATGAPAKLKVKCSICKTITDEIESQVDDSGQMKLL